MPDPISGSRAHSTASAFRDPAIDAALADLNPLRGGADLTEGPKSLDHDAASIPYAALPQDYLDHIANAAKAAAAVGPSTDAQTANAARNARVTVALDRLVNEYSGGFVGPHGPTTVRPMFHMFRGYQEKLTPEGAAEVRRVLSNLSKEDQAAVNVARTGRATPAELHAAIRALQHAGGLPPPNADAPNESDASRLRSMQWRYGIGIDCAGFVEEALVRVHGEGGRASLASRGNENFVGLSHRTGWTSIAPGDLRAGDAVQLRNHGKDVGHNVIVASATTVSPSEVARLGRHVLGDGKAFFAGSGPFKAYQVDSSWGAGEIGDHAGGYRRDTWFYDQGSGAWGSFAARSECLTMDKDGPAGEIFAGGARPRRSLLNEGPR